MTHAARCQVLYPTRTDPLPFARSSVAERRPDAPRATEHGRLIMRPTTSEKSLRRSGGQVPTHKPGTQRDRVHALKLQQGSGNAKPKPHCAVNCYPGTAGFSSLLGPHAYGRRARRAARPERTGRVCMPVSLVCVRRARLIMGPILQALPLRRRAPRQFIQMMSAGVFN